MPDTFEREIKLRFESVAAARRTMAAVDARPLHPRQFQDDRLLDWPDGRLRRKGCTLRVRHQSEGAFLTFKGPPQIMTVKIREELETTVGDALLLLRLLERLGLQVWFRYQKFREEYERENVILTIDETPIGTFVEIEGDEQGITATAKAMGQHPADYVLESYRSLFVSACADKNLPATDMVFNSKQ